jgi:hypothetical protein
MEGINVLGLLLGFLAVLVFGMAALVALGLWMARRKNAAIIVFAAGWLSASLIGVVTALTCLEHDFNREGSDTPLILLAALSFFLSGVGQFVAARRRPWIYAVALGCAAGSILFLLLATGLLSADVFGNLDFHLDRNLSISFSLLFAVTSVLVAVLFPSTSAG